MDKHNLESMLKGIGITEEESTKPNQTKSKRACFDYQKGSCFRGASCRFRHVMPEDIAFEQQQQRLANQRAQQLENSSRSSSKEKVRVCGIYVCMPLLCRLCELFCASYLVRAFMCSHRVHFLANTSQRFHRSQLFFRINRTARFQATRRLGGGGEEGARTAWTAASTHR